MRSFPHRGWLTVLLTVALLFSACTTSSPTESTADDPGAATALPEIRDSPPPSPEPQVDEADDESDDNSDDESDDEANENASGGFDDPTAGPDRAPDEPRTVPPLTLPSSAPGTDEAAQGLIAELERFLTDEQRANGVPWPDNRNPDPVAVYRSDAEFQRWMTENNPTPSLVEAYTAPGSPERGFDLEIFEFFNNFDLRAGPADPPYSMRIEELVHPAATGITDALLEQVPEGSAAIVYWDSVGSSDTFTSDGQYWATDDGWTDVGPWVAIMAPTDVGWQVWWDELTEPPPPGSREQRGTPQEETPRVDV